MTMKGLQTYPGVIDNDCTGEIKVTAKAVDSIITIPQGERIAQLILLPLMNTDNKIQHQKEEMGVLDHQIFTGYRR